MWLMIWNPISVLSMPRPINAGFRHQSSIARSKKESWRCKPPAAELPAQSWWFSKHACWDSDFTGMCHGNPMQSLDRSKWALKCRGVNSNFLSLPVWPNGETCPCNGQRVQLSHALPRIEWGQEGRSLMEEKATEPRDGRPQSSRSSMGQGLQILRKTSVSSG